MPCQQNTAWLFFLPQLPCAGAVEKGAWEKSGAFSFALPHPSFGSSWERLLFLLQTIKALSGKHTLTCQHAKPALSAELWSRERERERQTSQYADEKGRTPGQPKLHNASVRTEWAGVTRAMAGDAFLFWAPCLHTGPLRPEIQGRVPRTWASRISAPFTWAAWPTVLVLSVSVTLLV